MSVKTLDARGLSCPEPVILANRAIKEGLGSFDMILSSEVSKENVIRAAAKAGYSYEVSMEGQDIKVIFKK
jgi:TusA-related sulfurtransferase